MAPGELSGDDSGAEKMKLREHWVAYGASVTDRVEQSDMSRRRCCGKPLAGHPHRAPRAHESVAMRPAAYQAVAAYLG